MSDNKFGEYVRQRRESLGKTLRALAAELNIAPAFLSDIEKGNRSVPKKHLENLVKSLLIEGEELSRFYDLVGDESPGGYPDLNEYVTKMAPARIALRRARDLSLTEEQWQKIIESMGDLK